MTDKDIKLPEKDSCRYFIACSKSGDAMCPLECGAFSETPPGLLPPLDASDPFAEPEDIRTDPEVMRVVAEMRGITSYSHSITHYGEWL